MLKTLTALSFVSLLLFLSNSYVAADPTSPPEPSAPRKPAASKPPPISVTSTAKDLDTYVEYYRRHGYTVTYNQQLFDRQGKVGLFRFAAKRRDGRDPSNVTAGINASTRTVSTSESSDTTTTIRANSAAQWRRHWRYSKTFYPTSHSTVK